MRSLSLTKQGEIKFSMATPWRKSNSWRIRNKPLCSKGPKQWKEKRKNSSKKPRKRNLRDLWSVEKAPMRNPFAARSQARKTRHLSPLWNGTRTSTTTFKLTSISSARTNWWTREVNSVKNTPQYVTSSIGHHRYVVALLSVKLVKMTQISFLFCLSSWLCNLIAQWCFFLVSV